MVSPEDIAEEWLSRSNEERDDLLDSRRRQQLEHGGNELPHSPEGSES